MQDKHLLLLDYVSEGRLSVDEAVTLIEAMDERPPQEIWLVPFPADAAEKICLN